MDALLVINASRKIGSLVCARRRGTRIVQRLGTPFPSNRHMHIPLSVRMLTWLGIWNMAFIRAHLADRIVYQSNFVKESWERIYGKVNKPFQVIYNGIDLSLFSAEGPKYESGADMCIISVEGTQCNPREHPAVLLAETLVGKGLSTEVLVFGDDYHKESSLWDTYPFVRFMGTVPNASLPYYYRGATVYVQIDAIAACPNSVIEALACGTPVIGFNTSVLPEMLSPQAGCCVNTSGNPWKGEAPGNVPGLVEAALEIYRDNGSYRKGARRLAEERYGLARMVYEYRNALFGGN